MLVPDRTLDEIRDRVDILTLIGERVALKKIGRSYRGLCPFHQEKSPSFYVHPERQYYHCFGCQASGDVLSFVMTVEGLSFREAVAELAERAGVELPQTAGDNETDRSRKQRLLSLLESAAVFFQNRLLALPEAHPAREELLRRAAAPTSVHAFRVGFADDAWETVTPHLLKQGYTAKECEQAGLSVPGKEGRSHYDRFRSRLMFPVTNARGQVVGFSGRHVEISEVKAQAAAAKYINSPEGPLFRKSELLLGLVQARTAIQRSGYALVCEGNFDVLALHSAGFEHSVAPLGTAFTNEHILLLKRYAERVVLLFDGDRAGQKAVYSALRSLEEAELTANVVTLPLGEDPDSFIRTHGAERLSRMIEHAPTGIQWLIESMAQDVGSNPTLKARAIKALGAFIKKVQNPVEVSLYLESIAQRFGVEDQNAIRNQMGLDGPKPTVKRVPIKGSNSRDTKRPSDQITKLEAELVGILLDVPSLIGGEDAKKIEELLTSPELRSIFLEIERCYRDSAETPQLVPQLLVHQLTHALNDTGLENNAARGWLKKRLSIQKYGPADALDTLRRGTVMLAKLRTERELERLSQEIQSALRKGDEELASALREKHINLARQTHRVMKDATR